MIALEDLADYGFTVTYDDSIRTLFVNKTHEPSLDFSPQIERGVVGTVCGYTYDDSTRCLNLSQLPDNELSYEEQIAAVYNHSADFPDDFRNIDRIRFDQLDILTFEKTTHGRGYATHLMLFYHNGLYINMSELISQAYRFTRAVDGGSYALLAFNGCLSDDYSTFTFDGEKRGFVSSGPGLHSTRFIASGSYSLGIKSGIVTTISESSEAPDNE